MSVFEKMIAPLWSQTPAKISVKNVLSHRHVKKWQECKKDEVHVFVHRQKRSDAVYVIKHGFEIKFKLRGRVDELDVRDYETLGLLPGERLYCNDCKEFCTNVLRTGRCYLCEEAETERSKLLQ